MKNSCNQKRYKRIFNLVIMTAILFLREGANAQEPNFVWAKNANGTDSEYGDAIATDESGNIYVTGFFSGTVTFGTTELTTSGGFDILVAKYDASGNVVWARRAGGTGWDKGLSIATDGLGNIYVTGHFAGTATFGTIELTGAGADDIFVVKYNASGNVVWAKRAGNTYYDWGCDIVTDKWDNVADTGYFYDSATFGPYQLTSYDNYSDIFITKYDPDGNVLWAMGAGGSDRDNGNGITTDGSGNIYIIGDFEESAIFGSTVLNSVELEDIFIAKYNTSGNVEWAKQIGGTSEDYGSAIATDGAGNIYLTGHFRQTVTFGTIELNCAGTEDIFIAKYNTSGDVVWVKQAGGTVDDGCRKLDRGYGIATDESGNSYVTGTFTGTVSFGTTQLTYAGESDIFITKYNGSGNVLWAKQAGGTEKDEGLDIAIDGSGDLTVVGYFTESATFGPTTLSGNNEDIFVAKLTEAPPAPTNLIALNGYNSAVPLAWEALYNGTPQGYNVYRNSQKIANNITRTYYRDEPVTNGQTYNYKVSAVYSGGESDFSNNFYGNALSNGYYVYAGWASSAPNLDGNINSGEWSNAATTNFTYPGESGTVTLYVMNDANYLYLAVDDAVDNSLDNDDTFGIVFDDNHNRELPASTPSNEGLLQMYWNNSVSNAFLGAYGYFPDNLNWDSWITPTGVSQEIAQSYGHVQYEGRIDLNSSPLQSSPGNTIGIAFYTWDGASSSFTGLWPEAILDLQTFTSGFGWFYAPFSYGDIELSSSSPVVDDPFTDLPKTFDLYQNYPNPFNSETIIQYTLSENTEVILSIYNSKGIRIRDLVHKTQSAGEYRISWNGKDSQDRDAANGIYYYVLKTSDFTQTKKMVLLR